MKIRLRRPPVGQDDIELWCRLLLLLPQVSGFRRFAFFHVQYLSALDPDHGGGGQLTELLPSSVVFFSQDITLFTWMRLPLLERKAVSPAGLRTFFFPGRTPLFFCLGPLSSSTQAAVPFFLLPAGPLTGSRLPPILFSGTSSFLFFPLLRFLISLVPVPLPGG